MKSPVLRPLSEELAAADFGDARLTKRLTQIVDRVAESPGSSFPALSRTDGELEAIYRFLGNDRVSHDAILQPHMEQTVLRCAEMPDPIVLHDTTEFWFKGIDGAREGLGYLAHGHRGYEGHVALAVRGTDTREPLGVLGFAPVVKEKPAKKRTRAQMSAAATAKPLEEKHSFRWLKLVEAVETRVGPEVRPIHVMDREADAYFLLAHLVSAERRFVIRGRHDRRLMDKEARLSDVLEEAEVRLEREVPIQHRKAKWLVGKKQPARSERLASLAIRSARVHVQRAGQSKSKIPNVTVNVVEVFEPRPPAGDEPIRWLLLTSEPIDTWEDCARVVDIYRTRWLIEEFFKALKTGCAYEKRQLTSLHALQNAFGLLAPVAWRLLVLRTAAKEQPTTVSTTFTPVELELLRNLSKRVKLSEHPTNEEALLAIAGLGGHLKRNGPPGWQTLGRGYERFLGALVGWLARSDEK